MSTSNMFLSRERARQPAKSTGLGKTFVSPIKQRNSKRKIQTLTNPVFGAQAKRARLERELAELQAGAAGPEYQPSDPSQERSPVEIISAPLENDDDMWIDEPAEQLQPADPPDNPPDDTPRPTQRRVTPNDQDLLLSERWKALVQTLIPDTLHYYAAARGRPVAPVQEQLQEPCPKSVCTETKEWKSLALYYDRMSLSATVFYLANDLQTFDRSRSNIAHAVPLPRYLFETVFSQPHPRSLVSVSQSIFSTSMQLSLSALVTPFRPYHMLSIHFMVEEVFIYWAEA